MFGSREETRWLSIIPLFDVACVDVACCRWDGLSDDGRCVLT